MKNCLRILVLIAAIGAAPAGLYAQGSEEEEGGGGADRYALAVGAGLVDPAGDVETYYMAAFRIGVGGRTSSDWRGRQAAGISGYLEPEIGYWKTDGENGSGSDLLLGVNLIGAIPLGAVDTFFGIGAGLHSIDAQLLELDSDETGSQSKLGLNAQFGIDLYLTRKMSVFGASRFDLVQDSRDNVTSKVYLGLRGRF